MDELLPYGHSGTRNGSVLCMYFMVKNTFFTFNINLTILGNAMAMLPSAIPWFHCYTKSFTICLPQSSKVVTLSDPKGAPWTTNKTLRNKTHE